jgi:hypothetical protein
MKAGLPVPIRVAEHPAPALPGGKVAKSLTWRMLPGRIAGPYPLLVNPGFATLVVANVSVSEPGPNSNAKPAGLTPDRLAEWLHLGRVGQVDGETPSRCNSAMNSLRGGVGKGMTFTAGAVWCCRLT